MVCLENQGFSTGTQFELNPHHSHYIVVKNSQDCNELYTFTNNLIHMLLKGEEFYGSFFNGKFPSLALLDFIFIIILIRNANKYGDTIGFNTDRW